MHFSLFTVIVALTALMSASATPAVSSTQCLETGVACYTDNQCCSEYCIVIMIVFGPISLPLEP
ncbi:hypothetical protein BDR04DRAFT_156721 [Suillus decipiens]|nr:hypothetical protein BDR04DRAFT_156721 [Suillus decipiens]